MDSRDIILNNPDIQDLLDQFHGEKNRQKIIQWFRHRTRIDSIFHDEYRIFIGRPTRLPRDVPASGLEDVERYARWMREVDISRMIAEPLRDEFPWNR